nr:hypothetical protein [Escherichia coli]
MNREVMHCDFVKSYA